MEKEVEGSLLLKEVKVEIRRMREFMKTIRGLIQNEHDSYGLSERHCHGTKCRRPTPCTCSLDRLSQACNLSGTVRLEIMLLGVLERTKNPVY